MSDQPPPTPREEPGPGAAEADRAHLRKLQRARRARVARAVLLLGVVVLLVVFVVRNVDPVRIDYVFFSRSSRLIYVLIVTALLGGVAGFLLGRPSRKTRPQDRDPDRPEGR